MEFRAGVILFLTCLLQGVISNDHKAELQMRMKNVRNAHEFLDAFVTDRNGNKVNLTREQSRFIESGDGLLASGDEAPLAIMDACSVRNMTYTFPRDDNPNLVYFPDCIMVEQCGGCTSGELLACEPTRTQDTAVTVLVVEYTYGGIGSFEFVGLRKVPVEKHLSCAPACRTKARDCHPLRHTYNPAKCECECRDSYVQECHDTKKRFDSDACDCVCKEEKACATESIFNRNTCECVPRRQFASANGGRGRTTTLPPTTTELCSDTDCPLNWIGVPQGSGCSCVPPEGSRFIMGGK